MRRTNAAILGTERPADPRPTLQTARLILRPLYAGDAPVVQRLAGAREIASVTLHVPHPYPDGVAEAWIAGHREAFERGTGITLGVCAAGVTARAEAAVCAAGTLLGVVSLMLTPEAQRGELGYWMGVPYWGHGYCTEAARALVDYGFRTLGLQRVVGSHLARNPASGRVMQKIGMRWEGCLRQHVMKWGVLEDIVYYGLLRAEWEAQQRA